MIYFSEGTHTYVNTETGKELVSVTTLLGKYKPKFDKKENAARVAKREGLNIDFVLDLWEKEKNKACDYGTAIHKVMEDFLVEGKQEDGYYDLYKSYKQEANRIFKGYKTFKAEERMYSIEDNIAGTADLVYEKEKSFMLGDFKTNKRFNFHSSFNEYMIGPLSHLTVCEFNTYALQLSLYAYLYEKMSNKKCDGLVIFYKESESNQDGVVTPYWRPIHVNYMKNEIIELIADYSKTNQLSLKSF